MTARNLPDRTLSLTLGCLLLLLAACGQTRPAQTQQAAPPARLKLGAEALLERHADKLKGRRVAVVAHRASIVYDSLHIVDALRAKGIEPVRVFAPEHGFRGEAEAGAHVADARDAATGLPVVSLYGKNKKPKAEHLKDVDLVLFDLQDVGARFYTYLSTLTYVMEACAEAGVEVWTLDRPNPNGQYVGGPALDTTYRSFVGLHPVPVVHGMTLGEMARLIRAEGWVAKAESLRLSVIRMEGYRHGMSWAETGVRWVPPSPNLPTPFSAEVYPLVCWFEGADVSVGRGTDAPFEQVGAPWHRGLHRQFWKDGAQNVRTTLNRDSLRGAATAFVPRSIAGVAVNPPHESDSCFALRVTELPAPGPQRFRAAAALLENFYQEQAEARKAGRPVKRAFFDAKTFDGLAGNAELRQALEEGRPLTPVVEGWERQSKAFEKLREAWRLYPD